MNTWGLRSSILQHAAYFRFTDANTARRQAKKLIRAKQWLKDNDLSAIEIGSKFSYERNRTTVLS